METQLNEGISYFSKPFACCTSSLHSLGKYFPQGSLVLFSESISSAQETDLDSCHEREYTGWYFRDEVLVVKDFENSINFSLHCFSASAEPHCTCWSGEGRVVFLSTKSFSEQIVQVVLAPVIFSFHRLSWKLIFPHTWMQAQSTNSPSTVHKQGSLSVPHTHLCVFPSSQTHQFIPSFHVAQYIPRYLPR